MTKPLTLLLPLSLALAAAPADADWQYTRWGMTPEEVVTASQGLATTVPTGQPDKGGALNDLDNTELLLEAPYQAGRYKFKVSFYFGKGDHRLSAVQMVLDKDRISQMGVELMNSLTQKYGTPTSEQKAPLIRRAEWRTDSESVTFLCIGGLDSPIGILVAYAPIKTRENEGL